MMDCDTEWRAVDKNIAEDIVSDCAIFIVSSCVLRLIFSRFFGILFGMLGNFKLGCTTYYVLMGFTVL